VTRGGRRPSQSQERLACNAIKKSTIRSPAQSINYGGIRMRAARYAGSRWLAGSGGEGRGGGGWGRELDSAIKWQFAIAALWACARSARVISPEILIDREPGDNPSDLARRRRHGAPWLPPPPRRSAWPLTGSRKPAGSASPRRPSRLAIHLSSSLEPKPSSTEVSPPTRNECDRALPPGQGRAARVRAERRRG